MYVTPKAGHVSLVPFELLHFNTSCVSYKNDSFEELITYWELILSTNHIYYQSPAAFLYIFKSVIKNKLLLPITNMSVSQ